MSATITEVIDAFKNYGVRAEAVPVDRSHVVVAGVNVWLGNRQDRHPTTTAYEPANGNGWVWGGSFQHGDHADADADHVCRRIIESGGS